ncbi:Anaphase-promoting complex subunit 1 [Boothiomyces sp. JEL0838]|nr:Anaphase-promoting complex subunit 1 [Boothiomyces sp. JEL0838]
MKLKTKSTNLTKYNFASKNDISIYYSDTQVQVYRNKKLLQNIHADIGMVAIAHFDSDAIVVINKCLTIYQQSDEIPKNLSFKVNKMFGLKNGVILDTQSGVFALLGIYSDYQKLSTSNTVLNVFNHDKDILVTSNDNQVDIYELVHSELDSIELKLVKTVKIKYTPDYCEIIKSNGTFYWFQCGQILVCYNSKFEIMQEFNSNCLSIQATQDEPDLLLYSESKISLWNGSFVPIEIERQEPKKRKTGSTDKRIIKIEKSFRNEVIITFTDSKERMKLDLQIRDHLANECLKAMEFCLPVDLYYKFRNQVLDWGSFTGLFCSYLGIRDSKLLRVCLGPKKLETLDQNNYQGVQKSEFSKHLNEILAYFHLIYQDLLLTVNEKLQHDMGMFMFNILNQYSHEWKIIYCIEGYGKTDHHYKVKSPIEIEGILNWIMKTVKFGYTEPYLNDRLLKNKQELPFCKDLQKILKIYYAIYSNSESLDFDLDFENFNPSVIFPIRNVLHKRKQKVTIEEYNHQTKEWSSSEWIAMKPEITRLRFHKDDRIKQISDIEDITAVQQSVLSVWIQKVFALPFGQAMLKFETAEIVPAQVFPIPAISKSARLLPLGTLVEYIIPPNSEIMEWPEFHIGVASALQISKECQDIDSSWIVFNQKKSATGPVIDSSHAGFLFGLGLLGHLRKLESADSLRNYFMPQYELITLSHLLGLACSFIGTMNEKVSHMLEVHLPSMLPNHSIELQTGHMLKTGAMVAYGILHLAKPSQYKYDKILSEINSISFKESAVENAGNDLYVIGCGFALGFVGLGKGKQGSKQVLSSLISQLKTPSNSNFAISALIALGLICLKSNNSYIAKQMQIPNSEHLLDFKEPECLLVHAICRNLVMWDEVEPSEIWIASQIPQFISDRIEKEQVINYKSEHIFHAYYSIYAGLLFVIGLKYAGSSNRNAFNLIKAFVTRLTLLDKNNFKGIPGKLFKVIIRMCMNTVVSALGMVMAGTGNFDAFDLLTKVQRQFGSEVTFGAHMALHLSLGLLFLGQGTITLGNSNLAVASLFCSLFPIYPSSATDNRYHLQALRHLWVFAIERRCIIPRDIESGSPVCVPIEITLQSGKSIKTFAPTIIPGSDKISSITILGPRYKGVRLSKETIDKQPTRLGFVVSVKRKVQYLPYMDDIDGQKGMLAASIPKSQKSNEDYQTRLHKVHERFIESFSSDSQILALVQNFCQDSSSVANFCKLAVYECLAREKPEMIETYLWVMNNIKSASANIPAYNKILLLTLLVEYYQANADTDLINPSFIKLINNKMKQSWNRFEGDYGKCISDYYQNDFLKYPPEIVGALLGYIRYNHLPDYDQFNRLKEEYHGLDPNLVEPAKLIILHTHIPEISFRNLEKVVQLMKN